MPEFKIVLKGRGKKKYRYTVNAPDRESAVKKARHEAMRANNGGNSK